MAGKRPHRLLVDTGNLMVSSPQAPSERTGEAEARAEVFLAAMQRMGYVALNVGIQDLALGVTPLRKVAKAHKVPLLSSNLVDKSGQPAFERLLVRDEKVLKVGFFGLMTQTPPELGRWVVDQGLVVREPVAEAKAVVRELQAQGCQLIVLLSQLSRQELEKVMEAVPEVTLALGSSQAELSTQLLPMGKGYFADAFTKGKYAGLLTVAVRGRKDQFVAARLREALQNQRTDLANQVQGLQDQLDNANKPGSPLKLDADSRAAMERQLATAKARLQTAVAQLDQQAQGPADASTLDLVMAALGNEIADEPWIQAKVDKWREKFPKPGGH